MKHIYCISGLGADERIFQRISIKGTELKHLPWPPFGRNDTMESYAGKISVMIPDEHPFILGLSFGGMMAVEIAKLRPVKKALLISSAKTKHEIPQLDGFLRFIISTKIVPSFVYCIPNPYICNLFGAYTIEEKRLLNSIIRDADGAFVKWAIHAIGLWQNETVPESVFHIHGTKDSVLPSKRSKPDIWIEGGTHMMVFNRAQEISAILEREIPA